MPLHVSSICVHHQEVKIALHSLWYHPTCRWDDTRGCVMQFWPPDDEHICSKHVEAWNKTYCKHILCIELVKYWDKCTEMYCQQNIEIFTIHWLTACNLRFSYRPINIQGPIRMCSAIRYQRLQNLVWMFFQHLFLLTSKQPSTTQWQQCGQACKVKQVVSI